MAILVLAFCAAGRAAVLTWQSDLIFLNTSFENASPFYWEVDANNVVHVYLVYDLERASPNRANGHWFFQVQAKPGAELTFVLHNFDNVWNGQKGSPIDQRTVCFVSPDGRTWQAMPTEKTADNCLRFKVRVDQGSLYLARLEPYRLSDLEAFKREIRADRRVEITPIGKTVEGRELEIIRVGNPDAAHRVFLRARAHPWEPGGNWVVQGLVRRLLRDDENAKRYLDAYCVYIMPMANKDGVARGRTRFNLLGADLNRKWDKPADPAINPENYALETWLGSMVAKGRKPDLMIDLHNDESGGLHVDHPAQGLDGVPQEHGPPGDGAPQVHLVHGALLSGDRRQPGNWRDWGGTARPLRRPCLRAGAQCQLDRGTERLSLRAKVGTPRRAIVRGVPPLFRGRTWAE